MTAPEREIPPQGWRRRQERMRYEVLLMLYGSAAADPEREVGTWCAFAGSLGAWDEEVWGAMVWLAEAGLVRIHDSRRVVFITLAGVRFIEVDARRRRTIRGISPPRHPGAASDP